MVNATATFVLTGNSLVLTLTNTDTAAQIISSGQAITGIEFNLATAAGNETVSGTGNLVNINSTAVTENSTGVTSTVYSVTATTTLPTVQLTEFSGGQPSEGILPSTGTGNVAGTSYTNSNNGISSHNPYVDGAAVFTFTGLTGLTSSTIASIISSVQIEFGTSQSDFITGIQTNQSSTPEPGTIRALPGRARATRSQPAPDPEATLAVQPETGEHAAHFFRRNRKTARDAGYFASLMLPDFGDD